MKEYKIRLEDDEAKALMDFIPSGTLVVPDPVLFGIGNQVEDQDGVEVTSTPAEYPCYFTPEFKEGTQIWLAVGLLSEGGDPNDYRTWAMELENGPDRGVHSPISASAFVPANTTTKVDFRPCDLDLLSEGELPEGCVKSKELAEKMFQLDARKDPPRLWRAPVLISLIDEIHSQLDLSSSTEENEWVHEYAETISNLRAKAQGMLDRGFDQIQFDEDGNPADDQRKEGASD